MRSPLMREVWIEIHMICTLLPPCRQSPLMREVWIEIRLGVVNNRLQTVTSHARGVD